MNGFGRGNDKQKEKKMSVISRETVGMTLLLFSVVAFLITATGHALFGDPGHAIAAFFLGLAGFDVYPVFALSVLLSVSMVAGKRIVSAKWTLRVCFVLLAVFLIVHTATTADYVALGYGGYLGACWDAAKSEIAHATGGGVLLGIVSYPVQALFTSAGAYVVFSLLLAASLYVFLLGTPLRRRISPSAIRGARRTDKPAETPADDVRTEGARPYPGGVAFDDLSAPRRAYTPETEEPREERPYAEEPRPSARAAARAGSREILFGTDPASSYRSNLIYDKDSYFNTRRPRSNVVPDGQSAPAAETRPVSYTERYASRAEEERPAMPRKVTDDRPRAEDGYAYPVEEDFDANYPQTPSYRAPEPAEPVKRDFYANDATPPASRSPEPVKRDFYANDATPPASRSPEPVKRDFYANDATPFASRSSEPVRRAPEASEPAPSASREESPFAAFRKSETPEGEPARPERESEERESSFRSLFSRSVPERTHIEDPADRQNDIPSSRFARAAEETPETPEPPVRQDRFVPEEDDLPERDSRVFDAPMRDSAADLFDDDADDADFREEPVREEPPARLRSEPRAPRETHRAELAYPSSEDAAPAPAPQKHVYRPYVRPGTEIFRVYDDAVAVPQEEIERNSAIIVDTLAGFKVDAEIVKVTCGSTVTRYDIDIPRNIAVSNVTKREAEISMRLHARDGVNMYANNESGAISIEVPNAHRATVGIRSVLQAEDFTKAKEGSLVFAIGKDIEGRNVCGNIVKMKHILVAGSTGSGKSVCLNAMLISLICKYSPEDLRLILIDPKKVEFAVFEGLPHLMINEIIPDAQKAVTALNWAIKEMERRYLLFEQKTRFQKLAVRNVDEYNQNLTEDEEKLPKIVIVVDELADLMSVAKKDIEERIQRLAQKARAAGIHLVIATQRPSVDVITGVIKGNLPTRLAFRVIQEVDSRTILDESGAEKLLGNGDMLYRTEGMFNCMRVQGAFLSSEEVQGIVEEIKANNEAYFDESVADYINKPASAGGEGGVSDDSDGDAVDPQYIRALGIVVKLGQASISLIQRKCSVGYNHAGKIMEWMEDMGYVSPFDGKAKARDVILTVPEYEEKYGKLD